MDERRIQHSSLLKIGTGLLNCMYWDGKLDGPGGKLCPVPLSDECLLLI